MSFKAYLQQRTKEKPQTGIRTYAPGQAVTTDYKYRQVALEAYQRNPYVYAALNKMADMYADLPFKLMRSDTQDEAMEVTDHEVLDLIERPNNQQGKTSFLREQFIYYMLSGRSGSRKYSPKTGENRGKARELWNIRPDAFNAIADDVTGSVGHFIMDESGDRIEREDMIYVTDFDPLNSEDGFSSVMSGQLAIDTFNQMLKWNLATMQNQGVPSVMIYSENGDLSKEDGRKIQQRWRERNTGWSNAREPFIGIGGLRIERLGQTAQEADWLESMKELAKMILISMGASPDVLIGGSTFENRKEAMRDLINTAVIPRAQTLFVEAFNNQLLPDYGDNLYLMIDKSQIELLQESQNELWDRVVKAFEGGLISVGEAREQMGMDADTEHSQDFYMKPGMQPIASDLNAEDVQ